LVLGAGLQVDAGRRDGGRSGVLSVSTWTGDIVSRRRIRHRRLGLLQRSRKEAVAEPDELREVAEEAAADESAEQGAVSPKTPKAPRIDKFFKAMAKMDASDLHLKSDAAPRVRVRGQIKALASGPISNRKIRSLLFEIMNEQDRRQFEENGSVDFAYQVEGVARFRVNAFLQRGLTSLAARRIPNQILSYAELNLPTSLSKIADLHQGLILVSGITGSGKSTTIASMIEQINQTRACHIVTLEDPIEFQFSDAKAFVNQREIGLDVASFHQALRYLMRQDPDVVLIGEMRDEETFSAALQAAESGHLVMGTVHASSTSGTITRVLELFPENSRDLVRSSLVFNLQAIISLKLLKTICEDPPRVPACEICIATQADRRKTGSRHHLRDQEFRRRGDDRFQ
jgi:twitching motility protein PilT